MCKQEGPHQPDLQRSVRSASATFSVHMQTRINSPQHTHTHDHVDGSDVRWRKQLHGSHGELQTAVPRCAPSWPHGEAGAFRGLHQQPSNSARVWVSSGLPPQYRADCHVVPDEPPPCVLERLCELHDGLVVEAKGIRQHYFRPYIQKLFQRQVCTLSPHLWPPPSLPITSLDCTTSDGSVFFASFQILRGNQELLTEMLDPQNFIDNKYGRSGF